MSADPLALTVGADLWLSLGGTNLAGAKRVALLAEIARAGSITQAAKAVGLSYKGAWDAIDAMNNLAGAPLVERSPGCFYHRTAPNDVARTEHLTFICTKARSPDFKSI